MPACKPAATTLPLTRMGLAQQATLSALLLFAVVFCVMAAPAHADETYVCEDGRTVTVRFGELAKLAKTEPCIARYLSARPSGLVLPASSAPLASADPQPTALGDVPLPVRKPPILKVQIAPELGPSHPATEIIVHREAPPSAAAATGDNGHFGPRVEQVVFRHASHHFYSDQPLPKRPADYRRVPIINAAPGEPAVFYHTR